LDLADDGTLWFFDASTRFGYDDVRDSLIEASATARLTSYRADTGVSTAPMDGFFAEGVAFVPEEQYVLGQRQGLEPFTGSG